MNRKTHKKNCYTCDKRGRLLLKNVCISKLEITVIPIPVVVTLCK